MRPVITLLFLILPFAAVSAAPMYVMSAEQWMRPRQGADLLADERLREHAHDPDDDEYADRMQAIGIVICKKSSLMKSRKFLGEV